jgi:hypothetical protein
MRLLRNLVVAAMVGALPATTAAQVDPVPSEPLWMDRVESHWLASGFVGSNFGADTDGASVNFGGNIGYLWRGALGGEFSAAFTPDFQLDPGRSALIAGEQPQVNSYMANLIGAIPMGFDGQWRPYISAGLGALTLRADTIPAAPGQPQIEPDDTRFAGNVGLGILGFMGNWGVRGDVRYFHGFAQDTAFDPVTNPTTDVGRQILSELGFWRANVGLAVRW